MATPAPDPIDDELVRNVISDPEVIARLDRVERRRRLSDLTTHSHDEVVARLAKRGVRRRPSSHDNS